MKKTPIIDIDNTIIIIYLRYRRWMKKAQKATSVYPKPIKIYNKKALIPFNKKHHKAIIIKGLLKKVKMGWYLLIF